MESSALETAATSSSDAKSIGIKTGHGIGVNREGVHDRRRSASMYSELEYEETEPLGQDASLETIALRALHTDDDPTLNPWTFRMFFLGEFSIPHHYLKC